MKKALLFVVSFAALVCSCDKQPEPVTPPEEEKEDLPLIEILSPEADASFDLQAVDTIEFEWTPIENVNSYKIILSLKEDMSNPVEMIATKNPMPVKAETLSDKLAGLGIAYEEEKTLYFSVIVYGSQENAAETQVRSITLKRRPEVVITNEDRIADPLTVKVAIVYEDFEVPGTGGKRMHEICALRAEGGYNLSGGGWYDPKKLIKEYEVGLEESSHGVVQYEVVDERYADRFFTYFRDQVNYDGTVKEYITLDTLLYLFETRQVDNNTSYDYVSMMKHYGYDKMVDDGELHEVWVYSFPAGGMYESQMIGSGAFWCNSPGLGAEQGAPCENLCIVMGLNYERTADLALHSCCHRVESIMNEVYGGWNYDKKSSITELTNWEKFSAHNLRYEKYEPQRAHIGKCHFPPNAQKDYDYGNTRFVYSYADTWYDYPNIKEENARMVSRTEWSHSGGDQYGYMLWYYDHIPHYKGLCPRDGHLNNWWHYIVHYKDALRQEQRLAGEFN